MRLKPILAIISLCLLFCPAALLSQEVETSTLPFRKDYSKFLFAVTSKAEKIEKATSKTLKRFVQRLAKDERRMQRQLSKADSNAAKRVFDGATDKLNKSLSIRRNGPIFSAGSSTYNPYLDTLKNSLLFIQSKSGELNSVELARLSTAIQAIERLENTNSETEFVKQYLRERKQQLKAEFSRVGLFKDLTKYNKEVYYYSQQVKEYKEVFAHPEKAERKALAAIKKLPAFQQFMKKNSALAGLFNLPQGYESIANVGGLQTRADVTDLLNQRSIAGGVGAAQTIRANVQGARQQLNKLQDKINSFGGDPELDMPEGFSPNNQRKKSFTKRLEIGTNIQTTRGSNFFVNTADLGGSLGYLLNDKSVLGIGASYKIGLGRGWKHIALTHQGAGLRTFLDYKIKSTFFASGGFEYNFQPLENPEFYVNQHKKDLAPWTQSGLIGISKIISLKSKVFTKTKAQLLWDFLSYQQLPQRQAIKFRIGYVF